MPIFCEHTRTIPFGFLAIVFCLSSLIKIPDEEQWRKPGCPLYHGTFWAARLAASGSQLVGLVWAIKARNTPNQTRVARLYNEMETDTFKSQCNVRVSGSRASARDDQCIVLSSPTLHYGR